MEKTNYPSIDRTQEVYYRNEPILDFKIEDTMYNTVLNNNINHLGAKATNYFDTVMNYKTLLKLVNKAASAFTNLGVKKNDIVGICMINTPEVIINLLALNKIGAVSKWIDLRAKEKDLIKYLTEDKCKYVVSFGDYARLIEQIIDSTYLEKVLVINPTDAISPIKRFIANNIIDKNNKPIVFNDKRFIQFQDFLKMGNNIITESIKYDKERPTVMIQSSGTTGKAKTIIHTDFSIGNSMYKLGMCDVPLTRGTKVLAPVPPFIGYGLFTGIYSSMVFGEEVILEPEISEKTALKNYGKYDISWAAPLHYNYLLNNLDKIDPKKHKPSWLITGGDKLEIRRQLEIERALGIHVINGYGNNEGLGPLTINPCYANKPGTVGIALYGTDLISYDNENNCELKYNEPGEICARTETCFVGYKNNEEETNKVKKLHADGHYWIHTGDLGFIDEQGYVYLTGRLVRVIIKEAFKISPISIESVINALPFVKECVTVGVKDKTYGHVPMAFIELKEEYLSMSDDCLEKIKKECLEHLKEYEVPSYYELIDKIPYTANNKQNYRELENIGNKRLSNELVLERSK